MCTPQMAPKAKAELDWGQEPIRVSRVGSGARALRRSSAAFPGALAGSWTRSGAGTVPAPTWPQLYPLPPNAAPWGVSWWVGELSL